MDSPLSTKSAILQALIQGEAYGIEIIDRVKERSGGSIRLGQGSVYPALRALERKGFIEAHWGEPRPERGGRPRRYYKLTAKGARAATEERTAIIGLLGVPGVVRV